MLVHSLRVNLDHQLRFPYPDIEALFNQHKRQRPFRLGETDPHLAVHEQAMVQVDDALLDAVRTGRVDLGVHLVALPGEAVQAQQIAVLGLYDVLFGCVAVQFAELDEVGCVP